jgi:perosamine synthetase
MAKDIVNTKHVLMGDAEETALLGAFRARELSGNSDAVPRYEQALSDYFESRCAVACSSGTAAILLALMVAKVEAGFEVIVSPAAPVMSALPVLALGAIPVFCDLEDPRSFRLDADLVAKAISSRTRAIISVPMWGYPFDTRPLREVADAHGVLYLEDCAHAHGAIYDGQRMGASAHCCAYSTHERKLIATGEGGFLLTDEPSIAEQLGILRNCGRHSDSKEPFGAKFGLNLRLPGVLAALGLAQLARLDARLQVRRSIACAMRERLKEIDMDELTVPIASDPSYYAFCATFRNYKETRLIAETLARRGIVSDTYAYDYRPMYQYAVFSKYRRFCPNAEQLATSLLALPCHEGVREEQIDIIADILAEGGRVATA